MIYSAIIPLFAGAFGWFATQFVGGPIRKFFDLRGEIIEQFIRTANIPAQYREPRRAGDDPKVFEMTDEETQRLNAAVITFRELSAKMAAFVENERIALSVIRWFGYGPEAAKQALMGISNTRHLYGLTRKKHLDDLAAALKFRTMRIA